MQLIREILVSGTRGITCGLARAGDAFAPGGWYPPPPRQPLSPARRTAADGAARAGPRLPHGNQG